jgi:D-3-phosphoglycerate dehydrogenase
MLKAVFTDHVFDNIDIIRETLSGVADVFEYQCTNDEEVMAVSRDADALLVVNYAPITQKIIRNMCHCKIISRFGIGIDSVDQGEASAKGIYVTNVPDYCIDEVSDHAVALMMHLERKLKAADHMVRETLRYRPQDLKPIKGLKGATAGIIGFGRIGRLTAKKLFAFGMKVIYYDPYVFGDTPIGESVARKASLEELMAQSDYIIIHAPYSGGNYHLINEQTLGYVEKAPILVNVGRGELVDTEALARSLRIGTVSAAGLDVLEGGEPIDTGSEIMQLDNVLFSPHSAWLSEKAFERLQAGGSRAVRQALIGEVPQNCVNLKMLEQNGLLLKG